MAAALSLALPSDGEEHKAYAPLSSVPVAKLVADRDPLDDAQSVITYVYAPHVNTYVPYCAPRGHMHEL